MLEFKIAVGDRQVSLRKDHNKTLSSLNGFSETFMVKTYKKSAFPNYTETQIKIYPFCLII